MSHESKLYFPSEIINQILLSVPPGDLLRFTSVSKPWKELIKSQKFISDHLAKSISSSNECNLRFSAEAELNDETLILIPTAISKDVPDIKLPDRDGMLSTFMVGSSNGILCIFDSVVGIIILNPSIGKMRTINFSTSLSLPLRNMNPIRLGFGFDDQTNDYNVIRIVSTSDYPFLDPGEDDNEIIDFADGTMVEVYSLRQNNWKKVYVVDTFPWKFLDSTCGLYLNNTIHWLANHVYEDKMQLVILSFNLCSLTFKEIRFPNNSSGYEPTTTIGLSNGCLSYIEFSSNTENVHDFNIWVMKDYGVEKSWIQQNLSQIEGTSERYRFLEENENTIIKGIYENPKDLSFAPFTPSLIWIDGE